MGEKLTCAVIAFSVGSICGFLTHVGIDHAQPAGLSFLIVVLAGLFVGGTTGLFVGISRKKVFISSFGLLGMILGGITAIVCFALLHLTANALPWYVVAAPASFLTGFLLCHLCGILLKLDRKD